MTYVPIRIVIADDHEIFREGFKLLLRNQQVIELVGEADNGRELLAIVANHQPDVVITDIKMPGIDGIEACKKIKREFPNIQVIALSMFNEDSLIMDMLEAGAKGYLLKNTNKEELIKAVQAVYEGSNYYSLATSNRLANMIAESKYNPYRNQPVKKLTPREKEIIQLICQQFSSKEIAATLGLSLRTIEDYREKIQKKIEARNSIGIVLYAIKHELYVVK
jgi:DNA-binding NarL/FixJ family response regulator